MDYLIAIFGLGLIVTFIVIVGLVRAAEFAKQRHCVLDVKAIKFPTLCPGFEKGQGGKISGRSHSFLIEESRIATLA